MLARILHHAQIPARQFADLLLVSRSKRLGGHQFGANTQHGGAGLMPPEALRAVLADPEPGRPDNLVDRAFLLAPGLDRYLEPGERVDGEDVVELEELLRL